MSAKPAGRTAFGLAAAPAGMRVVQDLINTARAGDADQLGDVRTAGDWLRRAADWPNRSRVWHSTKTCGNLSNLRASRSRRRAATQN